MNLDGPKADRDESLTRINVEQPTPDHVASPAASEPEKLGKAGANRITLAVPISAPIRPLSPDTISNLSADEYEQLRPSHSHDGPEILFDSPSSNGWRGKIERSWIRNKGLFFMLIAQIFGVLMNVTTRLLEIEGNQGKGMHPAQILFARMSITCLLASIYMWYYEIPHFPLGMPGIRWLLIIRGLAGFGGVFGMYFSLLYLPLADATVITFLAPGLACLACSFLLKEPFTRVEQVGGLISLIGVVLIARPTSLFSLSENTGSTGTVADSIPYSNTTASADASSYQNVTPTQRLTAVGVSLIGVLGSAVVYTVIRWIGKRAHPLITVNYFAAWCTVVSVIAQSALPDIGWLLPSDLKEWGYLLFLGICGFTMQFLLAAALAYEKSSRATNMTYTSMLFALLFDKLIFGHTPGIMSILGSSLILGSAITVALQKAPTTLQHKESIDGLQNDEETRAGLISGVRDFEISEDHGRMPVQEVQLRTLR